MAKNSIQYVCNNCGAKSNAWSGRCYACGEWNTISEELEISNVKTATKAGKSLPIADLKQLIRHGGEKRLSSGIGEVDNVLGGGFVMGSVNLVAGQPGIGKSTLLLQIASLISKDSKVLYVSGEESPQQIGMRAKRLGAQQDNLQIASSSSADDIARTILDGDYQFVVVDSIQTIRVDGVGSAPGTISQITNSTHLITAVAKQTDTALVLVGHVTKEGSIAGPKVLEHMVDVVLQLDGDRYGGLKMLRGIKNRYGSTNETGIFDMKDNGLMPVSNPSATLLAERQVNDGSIVLATMEGSRPILVEVQALVNKTNYGYPKRATSGIDLNRVNLLIAMLEKRTKLNLSDQDIYVNIVGGIKINEPASDLAICMAIASASKGMQLKKNAVVFGELGLSGEVRHVPNVDKRLAEAKKLGFDGGIGPVVRTGRKPSNLFSVSSVKEALNKYLSN